MNQKQTLYFFIDTETGGLTRECSLLTFDGTLLDENLSIIEKVSYKIKPDDGMYKIHAEAMLVNKIDLLQHNKGAVPLLEVAKQFRAWATNIKQNRYPNCEIVVGGQNVWFDIEFLKQTLMPDWSEYFSRRIIDLQSISLLFKAANLIPSKQRISLSEMVKYFEIPISQENMHSSDVDVAASIEIFKKYITLIQCHGTARKNT
jgi:DNA polymerase III alpha subunit (gram-positive type)